MTNTTTPNELDVAEAQVKELASERAYIDFELKRRTADLKRLQDEAQSPKPAFAQSFHYGIDTVGKATIFFGGFLAVYVTAWSTRSAWGLLYLALWVSWAILCRALMVHLSTWVRKRAEIRTRRLVSDRPHWF